MNKKIITAGVATLILAAAATTAFAYQGDATKRGPNYTPERHAAMTAAITSGNYDAWKQLHVANTRMSSVITKDNFPKFVEMWKLEQAGKTAEAKVIRQQLGLGMGQGMGNGRGQGTGQGMGRGMHRGYQAN